MKKVAILTLFYRNYNYGGLLQGYALKKTIDSIEGVNADVLRYLNGDNPIYNNLMQQTKQYGKRMFVKKVLEKSVEKGTFIIKNKIANRFKLYDNFIEDCVNSDGREYTDANIKDTLKIYDCYISGSDQVWNPNCIRNGFLQTFVPDEKTKISYAASIGRGRLTAREQEIIAKNVERFDYVSVREKTAKDLLQNKVKKDISVVLDPVFLLEKSQWNFDVNLEEIEPDRYILVYSFSDSRKYRKKAEKLCKEKGLKLVYIPYAKQKFNLFDNTGVGQKLYNVGPKEFVYLINNANCILTDSFHGVAFSIILNKSFYVFERDNKKNSTSMNSRIYDLLDRFGLRERIVTSKNFDKIEKNNINYDIINKKIERYKKEAFDFLKKAIMNEE